MYKIVIVLIFVAVFVIQGLYFGNEAQEISDRKGYHDNWIWKGFFLGEYAVTKALALPDISNPHQSKYGENSWVCTCGKRNPAEAAQCEGCGKAKMQDDPA